MPRIKQKIRINGQFPSGPLLAFWIRIKKLLPEYFIAGYYFLLKTLT